MADKTKIEWTDATWNPVVGCTKVSPGCKSCYAERFAKRQGKDFSLVTPHYSRLNQPLHWREPRMVFVCSMGDLFHEHVEFEFIDQVFDVMDRAERHTFQVLTKRPERMLEYFNEEPESRPILHNVWLGVSVENQEMADKRIPLLLKTPATLRFVSCEPLLGPINLTGNNEGLIWPWAEAIAENHGIEWVIVGGESGPKARPMAPNWVQSIRDDCLRIGVPFFFKQWGGLYPKSGGRELDGRTWDEMP